MSPLACALTSLADMEVAIVLFVFAGTYLLCSFLLMLALCRSAAVADRRPGHVPVEGLHGSHPATSIATAKSTIHRPTPSAVSVHRAGAGLVLAFALAVGVVGMLGAWQSPMSLHSPGVRAEESQTPPASDSTWST